MRKPEQIKIVALRIDGGTQMREGLNAEHVDDLVAAVQAGDPLPPIVVFRDEQGILWLADGFHRVEAFRRAGRTSISADVRDGSKRDALIAAAGANANHGLKRTNEDKRRAVRALLSDPELAVQSDRQLALLARVDHKTVSTIRREMKSGEFPSGSNRWAASDARGSGGEIPSSPAESGGEIPSSPAESGGEIPSDPSAGPIQLEPGDYAIEECSEARQILSSLKMVIEAHRRLQKLPHAGYWFQRFKQDFESGIAIARTALKNATPTKLCPRCQGKGCDACGKTGAMPEEFHKCVTAADRVAMAAGGKFN